MDPSKIVFLINEEVRAVKCQYEPEGTSSVFKTFDESINVDDLVTVETNTRHGFTVMKVTEVDIDIDLDSSTPVKWLVSRVDLDAYSDLRRNEDAAISAVKSAEKRRRKAELRDAIFKDHEEKLKTLALAKPDDEGLTE